MSHKYHSRTRFGWLRERRVICDAARATIAHVAARHSKRARGFGFSHPSRARSLRARGGAGPLESDGVRPRDRWLANLAHEDCRVSRGFRVARLASTMKHGRHFRKLGRDSAHRWAMMRTMVTQLIEHERIQTTVARAKELRRVADRVVTFAKKGTLTARRRAAAVVRTDAMVQKLFTEFAEVSRARRRIHAGAADWAAQERQREDGVHRVRRSRGGAQAARPARGSGSRGPRRSSSTGR